jgi:hypothetical protein
LLATRLARIVLIQTASFDQEELNMTKQKLATLDAARGAGRTLVHVVAVIAGLIFMIVGLAMGVTLVMLPVGIAVGFVGMFLFLWGIFGRAEGVAEPDGKSSIDGTIPAGVSR